VTAASFCERQLSLTKRCNNQSLLYLATLGVYLGIVLAGGTPSVFGQARNAVSKDAEIADGQYPQVNFDLSVMVYLQDVESFLADLRKLRERQRLDLSRAVFSVAQSTRLPCVAANRAGSYTAEKLSSSLEALCPLLERYSRIFTDGYALPDCLEAAAFPNLTATDSRFELTGNTRGLSITIEARKASPERAAELARLLPETFERFRERTAQSLRDRIIESTRIASREKTVYLTTRLPRSELDRLLAADSR
jgi:hypothetical protein